MTYEPTVITPRDKAAKPSPIRANTTQMSLNRKDQRELGFPLTPADRASAGVESTPASPEESEGRT